MVAGFIFQFRFFTINSFGSYFILFLLWGHVLVISSYFFSTFFDSKRNALLTGYFFIIGMSLLCAYDFFIFLGDPYTVNAQLQFGLSVIPTVVLYRALLYLANEVAFSGPGFRYSKRTRVATLTNF